MLLSTHRSAAASKACSANTRTPPMHRRDPLPAALLLGALVAGCAQPALDLAPPRSDRPWQPSTNGQGEIVPGKSAPVSASSYVLPANPSLGAVPAAPALDSGHPYTLADL